MIDTPAARAVEAAGLDHRVLTYGRVDSIEQASVARNVPISSIIKTLAVRRGEDDYVLVLVGGDRAMDWKKLRALLGVSRLSLVDQSDFLAVTGYGRGAVTPFGTVRPLPVIVDSAASLLEEMSLGGGTFGQAIHLAARDVVAHFESTVADVTKPVASSE